MSQKKCRFSVDNDVALPITSAGMKSLLKKWTMKLAWWALALLIILIGIWICLLNYYAWPVAMDSVGEIPNLP